MRYLLLYDLPMTEKEDIREYNRFYTNIKRIGFYMIQYSVYAKTVNNDSEKKVMMNKLKEIIPKGGSIRLLKITEKQYESMVMLRGINNSHETIVGNNERVWIK